MIQVSTAELKTRLGRYLRLVREGQVVSITSHHHPVAKLVPVSDADEPSVIAPTRPIAELKSLGPVKLKRRVDGLQVLLDDRRRR